MRAEIVAYDIASGTTTRLTDDELLDRVVSVSPDGDTIAWSKCEVDGTSCDIWTARREAGGWSTSRLTGTEGEDRFPDTDGTTVVYDLTRGGERDVYAQPVGGGAERRLELSGTQANPNISRGVVSFETFDVAAATPSWDLAAWDLASGAAYRLTSTPGDETLNDISVGADRSVRVPHSIADDVELVSFSLPDATDPYPFGGFTSPIDAPPVVNMAKAGSAVPVKFSLGGDRGLDVLAEGYPRSEQVPCDSSDPVDGIEATNTTNPAGLTYSADEDQYTYVWKTSGEWAGTCRQFVLKLNDGTAHRASFRFR